MDVVLQSRPPEYGPGRFHPKAASGHGCITRLLLGPVEIGVITLEIMQNDVIICPMRTLVDLKCIYFLLKKYYLFFSCCIHL